MFEGDRVRAQTDPALLERIDAELEQRIRYYATQTCGVISNRLMELEQEWDIERHLQIGAAGLGITGLILGLTSNRKWLLLTCGALGCLLQHSVSRTSLPVSLLRRRGIRTKSEIDREKFALKALRGDFENMPAKTDNNDILRAHDALRAVAY